MRVVVNNIETAKSRSCMIVCISTVFVLFFTAGCSGCKGKKAKKPKKVELEEFELGPRQARRTTPLSRCEKRKPPPPDPETLPSVARILPQWVRSLKAVTVLKVMEAPSKEAALMGEIKMVSRLPLLPYKPPEGGCRRYWLKLEKGAWVCGEDLAPDRREPLMKVQPLMKQGSILPGLYAFVRSGGAKTFAKRAHIVESKPSGELPAGTLIRWLDTVSIAGQPFWWISKKVYVSAARLLRHHPSKFQGLHLREQGLKLPVAMIRAKTKGAQVFDKPGGKEIMRVPHHSGWEILDQTKVGITKYYRIKPGWILARRVISAWPSKTPAGIAECEKWIELVVDHQSLVAYEGDEPVYATMISSGDKKHPTKYGVFRIWWKRAQTDMSSVPGMAGPETYRVDDVPWAQFFWRGMALHGAYWHTDFGNRRSHGCVNLSPIDAKWLYDWTEPKVPPAWINRRSNERFPGTLIRIRHKLDHDPPFHGYARKLAPREAVRELDEARQRRMHKKSLDLIQNKAGKPGK